MSLSTTFDRLFFRLSTFLLFLPFKRTMTLPNSSSALVWQIVKKSNAFAVRGRTGDRPRFSRERGNLMSLHSFKHSGEDDD
jgi:hypothetical protein